MLARLVFGLALGGSAEVTTASDDTRTCATTAIATEQGSAEQGYAMLWKRFEISYV